MSNPAPVELVVRCYAAADRIEQSGMCADVIGTLHLFRAAGEELVRLAEALAAAEALAIALRQEHADHINKAVETAIAAATLEETTRKPRRKK